MLLYLAEYLAKTYSGFNVFQYLTLRAILGVLTALVISLVIGPYLIRKLSYHQIGQTVRDDGPKTHFSKAGTPTMGGVLIWITTLLFSLFFYYLAKLLPWEIFENLNFLTRRETLLPLGSSES